MDIATLIVLIAVLLMVLAYVAQPLVLGRRPGETSRPGSAALRRRADMLAERNRLLAAINALDFDHSTNQVADDDWEAQRHALVAQGVDVLRQLDALPAPDPSTADPIEAAVTALRAAGETAAPTPVKSASSRRGKSKPQPAETRFCPHCGQPVEPGDRFCASCGNPL